MRHRVAPPRVVSLSGWRVAGFGVVLVVDIGFEIRGSLGSSSCFSDLQWSPKVACWVRVRIGVFVDLSLAVVQWQRVGVAAISVTSPSLLVACVDVSLYLK